MSPKFVTLYSDIANRVSELSTAVRLKVGAVVVKDDKVISIGYNGTPPGWDNVCEMHNGESLITKPEVIHAEMNAIGKLARGTSDGEGAYMFITHAPCVECAKLIHVSGIKAVFFNNYYRDEVGLIFLAKAGVVCNKID